MADMTVKRKEELQTAYGGGMYLARAGLGVSSFGMQIEDLPPNWDGYPEHDHTGDGQEEVYIVLSGSATLVAGGQEHRLEPGVFARVGPEEKRRVVPGDEGASILVLGATPGQAYTPPEFSLEPEPEPLAT